MNVIKTSIPDLLILEPKVFGDSRGVFMESFNAKTSKKVPCIEVGIARNGDHLSDLNSIYLEKQQPDVQMPDVQMPGRGYARLYTGTHDSLIEASQFIQTLEKRQDLKVCCSEEICWRTGWISDEQMAEQAKRLGKSGYGQYLFLISRR